MWSWLKRLSIYVLIIWNMLLMIVVIKMYNHMTALQTNMNLTIRNQTRIVDDMTILTNSQETLFYLHSDHIEYYGMVTAYFRRFHKEVKEIQQTREILKEYADEDQKNP